MNRWGAVAVIAVVIALRTDAVPTKVTVRAMSRDAKVMGTKVGGARITIRDAKNGRVLAEGKQLGGTGDTKTIMVAPHARGGLVYGAGDAGSFVATIDHEHPTWVEVAAEGALGFPQSTARASKTLLLVPGEDIEGEGILLELHGFNVDLVRPAESTAKAGEPITVRAKLTMT